MFFLRLTLTIVVLASLAALPAGAQQAIFTSTSGGTAVNANIFDTKADVYLNGGPQRPGGAGLTDGTYYFQVTNPSGSVLLSLDNAECRQLQVIGGVVAGATGSCPHANGTYNSNNGSTPVQLILFDSTPNNGYVYKVWLIPTVCAEVGSDGKEIIIPQGCGTKTDVFKVNEDGGGGHDLATITGVKFYDTNTDGAQNNGEVGIEGWRIERTFDFELADFVFTIGVNGVYTFPILVPAGNGAHTISEVSPRPGWYPAGQWINTTLTSGEVTVDGVATYPGPNFGNVCVGPGGGKTLGFWSNKNGQAKMNDDGSLTPELGLLSGLNLRNGTGANFDPANYAAFRTWILGASATNMAYMLSAQLAAIELNVEAGFVGGGALVYAGTALGICAVVANGAGFVSVGDLMTAANLSLGTYNVTLSGDPQRGCQEYLKTALDNANNNKTFVQDPGSCPFTTPY